MLHQFELLAACEYALLLAVLCYAHGEGDGVVVQVELQGVDDAALDFLHLLEGYLVVDHYLDGWEVEDGGADVLHAGGYAAEFLWHAVAHGYPLQLKFMLVEDALLLG